MAALDWIFSTPTFRATDFEKHAGIPVPTAKRILRLLENAEILAVIREASGRRPRVLCLSSCWPLRRGDLDPKLVDHETPIRDPQSRLSFSRDPQASLPHSARHLSHHLLIQPR